MPSKLSDLQELFSNNTLAGTFRDKTLMYIPMDDKQNYTFSRSYYWLKRLVTAKLYQLRFKF